MSAEYTENQLRYRRSLGVSRAWERERELVSKGRGTREWTVPQQKELLKTGRVKGVQGHHMKSVSKYPQYADNPKNIQFLDTRKNNNEHLKAHRGSYRNASDGRYNVKTGKIRPMEEGKPRAMYSYELKDKAIEKRGYTKYAREAESAKKGGASKASTKAGVQYNGKTYDRTLAKSGDKAGISKTANRQSGAKTAEKPRADAKASRYGAKTSGSAVKSGQARSGGYGQKTSGNTSSQARGTGGASHGRSSSGGGQGSSKGGQSR